MDPVELFSAYSGQGFAGLVAGVSAWLTTRRGLNRAIADAVRVELAPVREEVSRLTKRVTALELAGGLRLAKRPDGEG